MKTENDEPVIDYMHGRHLPDDRGGGNGFCSDAFLESPACLEQYKQPSATIRELSGFLKDMRLKSFYNEAREHTLTFGLTTEDNADTELKEKYGIVIWFLRLPSLPTNVPGNRTGY